MSQASSENHAAVSPRPTLVALPEATASPTFPFSTPREPAASVPRPVLRPGCRLGDYRLEALLGRGASASVWRATDLRLQMAVALKLFLPRDRGGMALLEGVMREARAASKVVSDHVIRVKDAGHFEGEQLGFIAMELCAGFHDAGAVGLADEGELVIGRTLEQELPESLDEAVRLMAQVARGVAAAHREGIFHRDIKPANILVRPGSRRAQVTDFGLTVAELGGEGSVRMDVSGANKRVILGTPEYMPPEAAEGLPAGLDAQRDRVLLTGLDVYGIGATLYAMLAGRPPYKPRHGADHKALDLIEQVRERPPVDLLDLPRTHLPCTEQVARVVRRAMARNPDSRYCSAVALAEDLEAIADGRPTTLDSAHPGLVGRLWLRRNRLQVSAGLSVAVMAASLLATALVGSRLGAEIEAGEAKIAELDALAATHAAEAANWRGEAGEAEQRFRKARDQHEEALAVVATTETSLASAKASNRRISSTLEETRAALVSSEQVVAERTTERDAALETASVERQRAETAESEREAARSAAVSQQDRAEAAEAALIAARSEVAGLEQALGAEQNRRESAEANAAALVRDVRQAHSERDAWKAEANHMERALSQARSRVRRLEAVVAANQEAEAY